MFRQQLQSNPGEADLRREWAKLHCREQPDEIMLGYQGIQQGIQLSLVGWMRMTALIGLTSHFSR